MPGEKARQENGGPEDGEVAIGAPVIAPVPSTVATITCWDWSSIQVSPAFMPVRDEVIVTDFASGTPPGNETIVLAGATGGAPLAGNAITASPPSPVAGSAPR